MTSALKIGLVGSGALGSALAQRLHQRRFKIIAVVSRNTRTAQHIAAKINCPHSGSDVSLLRNCNFIIIAVPDAQISRVATKISDKSLVSRNTILVHTSGALNANILLTVKSSGRSKFSVAALHPMQTFPADVKWNNQTLDNYFNNIYFGIDGDKRALPVLKNVARAIGAGAFIIPGKMKALYHAGGVMTSNFMIALMFLAQKIYSHAGLDERQSEQLLQPIMLQTLHNIFKFGVVSSLTGPAARNDQTIIKKHLKDLKVFGTDFQNVYKDLTRICYMIAQNRELK